MLRFTLIPWCAVVCLAQPAKEPPKPPADVDAALRARVLEFFQYHVTGEFRKAEALVAEDSKDLFYNRNKPRYIKVVDIARIDYEPDFQKAVAIVNVVSPQLIPGWDEGPPTLPIPTNWKLENGKWCWYLEPESLLRTPFGAISLNTAAAAAQTAPGQLPPGFLPNNPSPALGMPPGVTPGAMPPMPPTANPMAPAAPAPDGSPALPAGADPKALAAIEGARRLSASMPMSAMTGMVPQQALDRIKPDKMAVTISPGATEKITFRNSGSDGRSLMLLGGIPGIDSKLDRREVPGGQSAVLTLTAGNDAKDGVLRIVVPQTAEMVAIQVKVK